MKVKKIKVTSKHNIDGKLSAVMISNKGLTNDDGDTMNRRLQKTTLSKASSALIGKAKLFSHAKFSGTPLKTDVQDMK